MQQFFVSYELFKNCPYLCSFLHFFIWSKASFHTNMLLFFLSSIQGSQFNPWSFCHSLSHSDFHSVFFVKVCSIPTTMIKCILFTGKEKSTSALFPWEENGGGKKKKDYILKHFRLWLLWIRKCTLLPQMEYRQLHCESKYYFCPFCLAVLLMLLRYIKIHLFVVRKMATFSSLCLSLWDQGMRK